MFIIIRYVNKNYNQDYFGDGKYGPNEPIYVTSDKAKADKFALESNNSALELREKIKKWNKQKEQCDKQYKDNKYPDTYKELINFNNSELGIKFIHDYCMNPRAYALVADRFNSELEKKIYADLGEDPSTDKSKYIYDFSVEEIQEL